MTNCSGAPIPVVRQFSFGNWSFMLGHTLGIGYWVIGHLF
jgi:hypothetical protein